MLDQNQREDRYLASTGRRDLTPRQRRRVNHKQDHQSEQAAARREGVAKVPRLPAGAPQGRQGVLLDRPAHALGPDRPLKNKRAPTESPSVRGPRNPAQPSDF